MSEKLVCLTLIFLLCQVIVTLASEVYKLKAHLTFEIMPKLCTNVELS